MLGLRLAARAGILAAAAVGALALAPTGSGEPLSGVAALQVALRSRGLYPAAIDGLLGPKTMRAVRAFQRKKHLLVDGIPGPQTRAALGRYSRYRLGGRVVVPGNSGWDVSEAQFLLRIHGFKPGPLDGFMGARSEEAVRRFQRATGLHVDGVIGPATTASLDTRRPEGPSGLSRRAGRRASHAGRLVIVRRDVHRLYFYRHGHPIKVFTVATGNRLTPSPRGKFRVVVKYRHPWWYPPQSKWARHRKPIPPGPGNPLGTRWMGISSPGVGMHGTPDPASVGYSVSHGCIRLRIRDAEALFRLVRVGTRVWIY
jgi:L,D-transpeptidase catalytic domain/Putative peptidoglycan binding domain